MTKQPRSGYRNAGPRGIAAPARIWLVAGALCLAGAQACTPVRDYRGFVPQENTLDQIHIGLPRAQVEEILGTPSAQSEIDGTRYYYISSTFETVAFLEPEEVDRKVYAIEFDETETVSHVAHYGMRDGKIFDFVSRQTPTRGKELTLVQEFFGNLGRFSSDRSILREQISRRDY